MLRRRSQCQTLARPRLCDASQNALVYKTYVLHKTDENIDIPSTDELVISGGSVHFGTNEETSITQIVAGQKHQYNFTDGGSYLISPTGGATRLSVAEKAALPSPIHSRSTR
jgi:hypothetical protein